MKKFLFLIYIFCLISMPVFSAEKYAQVDIEYIMSKYPAAGQVTEWLRQEEIKLQKFALNARQDVESAATPEARKAKEDKYNSEYRTMVANIKKQEEIKGKEIYNKFNSAVQTVAKNGGYTLVVPSALYGATDISDLVINELNKK